LNGIDQEIERLSRQIASLAHPGKAFFTMQGDHAAGAPSLGLGIDISDQLDSPALFMTKIVCPASYWKGLRQPDFGCGGPTAPGRRSICRYRGSMWAKKRL
jgi:hypothetical protein